MRLALESHQRQGELVFKHLRAGLLGFEPAKAAAAVMRQPFEIHHGAALLGEASKTSVSLPVPPPSNCSGQERSNWLSTQRRKLL